MLNVLEQDQAATHGRHLGSPPDRPGREIAVVVLLAVLAAAAWLPFLHTPLTSDEGGFLLLGHQWRPGSSLYGDYWVDRPPLLGWLFALAWHLGPPHGLAAVGVKLLGAAASGIAVLLTGVLARLVAPGAPRRRTAAVGLGAVLLSSPLLGMPETDGEVLAVPFVLAGLCCLVAALRARRPMLPAAGAGAAATAAALVKQDMIDVVVLAAVIVAVRRGNGLASRTVAFCAGAAAVLAVAVAGAAARGTTPAGLWDAVVTFRLRASAVIGASASTATPERLGLITAAFVASGAAALLVAYVLVVLRTRNPRHELAWPALAMVAWELFAVVMGGGYWLHYLTGMVPGLVLLTLVVRPTHRQRRVVSVLLAYAVVATGAVWAHQAISPLRLDTDDARVVGFLRAHAHRGDGVVVAYGHPDIVEGAGLTSPYEELWSLPVRVRDPHLDTLRGVLRSPRAPRWVITPRSGLVSWGMRATTAQDELRERYHEQATYGTWHVWERNLGAPVR